MRYRAPYLWKPGFVQADCAKLTCGSQSCAWEGLVSEGWRAPQCFLDRIQVYEVKGGLGPGSKDQDWKAQHVTIWSWPLDVTHRPFQEYRQCCSQHSRKLGQLYHLRCLSWLFSLWKLREAETIAMSKADIVPLNMFCGLLGCGPQWALSFRFPHCCCVCMRMCVSRRDKVVIISNPASVISEFIGDGLVLQMSQKFMSRTIHENSGFWSKGREMREKNWPVSVKRVGVACSEIDLSDLWLRVSCERVLLISSFG